MADGKQTRRGRPAGVPMSTHHRRKIAKSLVLEHLIEHATGERDMVGTQVTAAGMLIDRILPKLAPVHLPGEEGNPELTFKTIIIGAPPEKEEDDGD